MPLAFPKPEPRAVTRARERRVKNLARADCIRQVFERARWRCEVCGRPVLRAGEMGATEWNVGHVHERQPRSLGGDPTDPEGCVLLCARHHAEAHRRG